MRCLQLEDEEEPFVLEDTCLLNTDNMDAHSCDTSSLASSDSGDPAHLKRRECTRAHNAPPFGIYKKVYTDDISFIANTICIQNGDVLQQVNNATPLCCVFPCEGGGGPWI